MDLSLGCPFYINISYYLSKKKKVVEWTDFHAPNGNEGIKKLKSNPNWELGNSLEDVI